MNKFLLRFSALLVLSPLVFGDISRTFRMQAPTARENGDPISLSELQAYRVQCGILPGGPYDVHQFDQQANGTAQESVTTGDVFTEGTYYCIATVTDQNGLRSGNSNEINFTVGRCDVSDCRPQPPVLNVSP